MTNVNSIVKKVETHFNFLYEKDFIISKAEYAPQFFGNWVVEFKSQDCIIYITNDRSSILLEFCPIQNQTINNRIILEKMIYILTNGKVIVEKFKENLFGGEKKQFVRLSNLLKEYIDNIIEYYKKLN